MAGELRSITVELEIPIRAGKERVWKALVNDIDLWWRRDFRITKANKRPTVDVVIHMVPMGREDARAAVVAFAGRAGRIVMISSCDVYLAYGRFRRSEPGDPVPTPLTEQSALRSVLFPYRTPDTPRDAYEYDYEKILMEEEVKDRAHLPAVVLRLPKVYGREDNADLATVYGETNYPTWRWTHGYVENVAHAIAVSAVHPRASDQVFNVGEATTPIVAERLAYLPPRPPSIKASRDTISGKTCPLTPRRSAPNWAMPTSSTRLPRCRRSRVPLASMNPAQIPDGEIS